MKVIVDIKEHQKDFILAWIKENNLNYKIEEDFDVPTWHIEEVETRKKQADVDPTVLITLDELKANLTKD